MLTFEEKGCMFNKQAQARKRSLKDIIIHSVVDYETFGLIMRHLI